MDTHDWWDVRNVLKMANDILSTIEGMTKDKREEAVQYLKRALLAS
jgi:hypothetical protein